MFSEKGISCKTSQTIGTKYVRDYPCKEEIHIVRMKLILLGEVLEWGIKDGNLMKYKQIYIR
jgi:hypothetical protein